MFTVTVSEKGGEVRHLEFDKPEVTIGRVQGNDIILPKGNVSKRHSRIVLKDGKFIIVDLKSTNGTYVNGRKITSPLVIKATDKVYIGDFILNVEDGGGAEARVAAPPTTPPGRKPPPPPGKKTLPQPQLPEELIEEPDELEDVPTASPPPPLATDLGIKSQGPRATLMGMPAVLAGAGGGPAAGPEARAGDHGSAREAADSRREPLAVVREGRAGAAHAHPPSPPAKRPGKVRAPDPKQAKVIELSKQVHDRLIQYLDLRRMDVDKLGDEELWEKTEGAICDIVEQMDSEGAIPAFVDQDGLVRDVLNEALGLGPLEEFVADDSINEIMVNRYDQIYIERAGRIIPVDKVFSSDRAVLAVIERIVAPLGRRIDESSPLVDARLRDGSRVNAIIPPLALRGPCLTIRKFRREALTVEDLYRFGTLSPKMASFLQTCVSARKNIIVSGGTGSGKTTTLNIISNFIPDEERILTIEDAAELQLHHEHWVQLESRPPNIEGKGQIAIRDLVRNSLRMRPDRIIVGEVRGGEALDMLQAMNTGHDGSLTTAHANSPRDALARIETMVLMSGMDLPVRAIREQLASAIDVVVHQARFADGSRKLTQISEITGMESEVITMQDIFVFKQEGVSSDGKVRGRFVATGFVPRFFEELRSRGLSVDVSMFRD